MATVTGSKRHLDITSDTLTTDLNITAGEKLFIGTTDANITSTTALVLNSTEVEKRTLGSLAFDSTSLGTAASSNTGDFATSAQGTKADTAHGWGDHADEGYLTSLPSHNHDDRYYTETEVGTFINRSYINKHDAVDLPIGWYTIATNTGDRASARFGIWDTDSGDHQSVTFYAAHHFGRDTSNTLTVLDNSYFSGNPFRYIRIKDAGTYDGAALQVYIDDASSSVNCAIVGDNFQTSGWVLCDWVADATSPPNVSNYSNFAVRSQVDLDNIAQGGFATTGDIFSGGDTQQYRNLTTADEGAGNGLDADTLDGQHASAFLTSLPSHNHDDRYYTETESDSRFVNVAGDTMTGSLGIGATSPSATLDVVGDIEYSTEGGTATRIVGKDATNKLTVTGVDSLVQAEVGSYINDRQFLAAIEADTTLASKYSLQFPTTIYDGYVTVSGTNDETLTLSDAGVYQITVDVVLDDGAVASDSYSLTVQNGLTTVHFSKQNFYEQQGIDEVACQFTFIVQLSSAIGYNLQLQNQALASAEIKRGYARIELLYQTP